MSKTPPCHESHIRRGDTDVVIFSTDGPVVLASVPAGALTAIGAPEPPPWPAAEPMFAAILGPTADRRGSITVGGAWAWVDGADGQDPQEVLGHPFDRNMVRWAVIALIGGGGLDDEDVLIVEVAAVIFVPGGGRVLRIVSKLDPRVFGIVMSLAPGAPTGGNPMPVDVAS